MSLRKCTIAVFLFMCAVSSLAQSNAFAVATSLQTDKEGLPAMPFRTDKWDSINSPKITAKQ